MTTLHAFHSSGEWDQPWRLFEDNVRRTRGGGRSLGTRTEVTAGKHNQALYQDDGWEVFHPPSQFTGGWIDCSVEWDAAVWKLRSSGLVTLNPDRLHTAKGFLLPPSTMPLVFLEHRVIGQTVVLGAFHLQLANTELRRAAWRVECEAIRSLSLELRRDHPGWEQVFQGDVNRNQRITALRDAVQARMLRGTRLRNAWVGHLPARGGTHGAWSILDLTVSTMRGRSFLLGDDASSDHRPFQTDLEM